MSELLADLDTRYVLADDDLARRAAERIRELESFIEAEGRCLLVPISDELAAGEDKNGRPNT